MLFGPVWRVDANQTLMLLPAISLVPNVWFLPTHRTVNPSACQPSSWVGSVEVHYGRTRLPLVPVSHRQLHWRNLNLIQLKQTHIEYPGSYIWLSPLCFDQCELSWMGGFCIRWRRDSWRVERGLMHHGRRTVRCLADYELAVQSEIYGVGRMGNTNGILSRFRFRDKRRLNYFILSQFWVPVQAIRHLTYLCWSSNFYGILCLSKAWLHSIRSFQFGMICFLAEWVIGTHWIFHLSIVPVSPLKLSSSSPISKSAKSMYWGKSPCIILHVVKYPLVFYYS